MTKLEYGLLVIGVLCFIPIVTADDGSGCRGWSPMGADGAVADCYSPQLYIQNQIIIQEQNQSNHLQAWNMCMWHTSTSIGSPTINPLKGNLNFTQCVNYVLENTK